MHHTTQPLPGDEGVGRETDAHGASEGRSGSSEEDRDGVKRLWPGPCTARGLVFTGCLITPKINKYFLKLSICTFSEEINKK